MNTLLIISIVITIAALGMYWMAKREVGTVKKEAVDLERKYALLDVKYGNEERENIFFSSEIEKLRKEFNAQSDELKQEKEKSKNLIWLIDTQYKPDLEKFKEELASLQQLAVQEISQDPKLFEPVRNGDFFLDFRTLIDWSSIEISLVDLIADAKLFEVFTSLLNVGLLPKPIQEDIDYQKDNGQIIIWTQEFNEDGDVIRAFTWREITTQILNKKEIITKYLNAVIQDSDRAMVIHKALSNKPARKEVAA